MTKQIEAITQINAVLTELVDTTSHAAARQRLLEIIASAAGYDYAFFVELEQDQTHMRVTSAYIPARLLQILEKTTGLSLLGYRYPIDLEATLNDPPNEVFEHFSDFYDSLPRGIGKAIDKILSLKSIASIRQRTKDKYLGAVNFIATKSDPDPDYELLKFLCENHLVYALRLMHEQAQRARQNVHYTENLEESVHERTAKLEKALARSAAAEEQLTGYCLDLEQARSELEIRANETDTLLQGLHTLTSATSREDIYSATLRVFQNVIEYEDVFVLEQQADTTLLPAASTNTIFEDISWQPGKFFTRVLSGEILAAFDIRMISEWQEQSDKVRIQACSALHIPLITANSAAILVCTHSEKGFFTKKHIRLAKRFTVLALQARQNAELFTQLEAERDSLERTISERTADLQALSQDLLAENADRRLAEKAVSESERRYHSLFERTNDAVFFISLDGVHLDANQQAATMLGYDLDELIGLEIDAVVAPQEYPGTQQVKKTLLAGETVPVYQRIFRKKDGTEFPVEINAALVRDADNQPIHIQSVVRDISQRVQAEAQMHLQASALDAAASSIVITNRDGQILWVNPAFTKLTGYSAEEAIGQNPRILKSGKHSPSLYKNLWKTIAAGEIWYGEIINKHKNGSLYHVEQIITPLKETGGNISHFIAIKQDVSERIRAKNAIESLAKFPEENPSPILRVTLAGEILYANLGSSSLLEAWDCGPDGNLPAHIFHLCLGENGVPQKKRTEVEAGDQIYALSFVPIEGMNYINIYGRDITAEKESDRAKADFIASVSHELRTPLAAILGYVEILIDEAPEELSEIHTEFLNIIFDSSHHLGRLVDDLLDVTKMEAGRFQLQFHQINFESVLQKSLSYIRPMAAEKGVNLTVQCPDTYPVLMADAARLEQVLVNLLSNGVKFTPQGGDVTLKISPENTDQLKILVIDTGIGISPEDMPHLFDRFYRAKDVSSANIEGTGLGLYIAKTIIESHGGKIGVRSQPGVGTHFEIGIPIVPSKLDTFE